MNLTEYRNKRIQEIKYFLRDIELDTLLSTVLENPNEYSHGDERNTKIFFKDYALNNAILGLSELYTELIDTKLSISITSKEEIDREIDEYVKNVMIFLEGFANYITSEYHNVEKISKPQDSNIDTSLKFYKFKIGDKIYEWYNSKSNKQYNTNNENKECTVDNLKTVLEYIRDLPKEIRSKLNKLEELLEIGRYFEERTPESDAFMKLYYSIKRSTDPNKIEEMYEEAKKLIPIKHR